MNFRQEVVPRHRVIQTGLALADKAEKYFDSDS